MRPPKDWKRPTKSPKTWSSSLKIGLQKSGKKSRSTKIGPLSSIRTVWPVLVRRSLPYPPTASSTPKLSRFSKTDSSQLLTRRALIGVPPKRLLLQPSLMMGTMCDFQDKMSREELSRTDMRTCSTKTRTEPMCQSTRSRAETPPRETSLPPTRIFPNLRFSASNLDTRKLVQTHSSCGKLNLVTLLMALRL